ncbi:MAG: hypothetical protein V7754_22910 [Halioglobus sp.]
MTHQLVSTPGQRVRSPLPNSRKSTVLCLIMLLLLPPCALQADDYEDERPRKTATVLPAALLKGDQWVLGEEAVQKDGLFEFQVQTVWGDFPVFGEAMLRLRLREFRAVGELEEVSSTKAAVEGAGRAFSKSFSRLGHAMIHPKQTARAMPQGTRRLYRKLVRYYDKIKGALADSDETGDESLEENGGSGEGAEQAGDNSSAAAEASVWLARKYGGVGSKSRRLSRELGVDPYTSNEILAYEIERVAQAQAVGSVSTKVLLPVLGALGLAATAANIAYTEDWREVFLHNAALMRDMGVSAELIGLFEVNEFFTPMTQVLIVAMLDIMDGVEDRWVVIEQASLLENESEALFFLESIMLAEWYHREKIPLDAFITDTLIPVARTQKGDLVAFTAADFFYWTQGAAEVTADFTNTYADHPGGRLLVMADYISPRAKEEVKLLGWEVLSGIRQSYDVEVPWGIQDH